MSLERVEEYVRFVAEAREVEAAGRGNLCQETREDEFHSGAVRNPTSQRTTMSARRPPMMVFMEIGSCMRSP